MPESLSSQMRLSIFDYNKRNYNTSIIGVFFCVRKIFLVEVGGIF